MTFYRVNIKVVVPKDKQAELLEAVKEKKDCSDLQTYFGEHFGKVLTRSLSQAKKVSGAKDLSGSLLTCAVADERGDFVFNYGLQGPYDDLVRFLENSYVQSILKFISPYSKSMMYRPYDKEKKPHGDFYVHIGEGGFNFKLPHMKLVGSASAPVHASKPVPATNSYSAVAKAAGAKARVSSLPPPPPLCPLGTVSQNLTYKMREVKKVEQDHAKAEADLKELQKKLKELAAKRMTLKGEVADLKKELKKLMEEEEEESEDEESDDEEDSDSDDDDE